MENTAISRPKPSDFIPGYRIEKLVGKGGMGEVHQATQLSLGRTVAVKLLNSELAKDETFVARFEKEGAALAALRHPNIVSIVDKGKNDATYYLVMEFVDGPSMREVMRSPLLDAAQSLRMMMQICRAIEYAHGRGVIHRDLKPENILFDEQAGGIAKVTDFGLAGFDDRAGPRKLNLTQTNVAMGTASYMAPEQQIDARSADQRADIYSLGVLLYELLIGEVPMGQFDAPSVKKPQLDKRLDGIVSKALKPNPNERYSNVSELLTDLEPLVPATSMLGTVQLSPMRLALQKARQVAQTALRAVEVVLVVSALVIITAAFLRSSAKSMRLPAGQELTTDFGSRWPLTTAGRIEREQHLVSLGDGPDVVSIVGSGRKPDLRGGEIGFTSPAEQPAGRALVDVNVDGDGLVFTSTVTVQATPRGKLEPLKEIFRGPRPDARAAVMLLGEPGRYVALVVSGSGEQPTLEWALGSEHRGAMTAPMPVPQGPVTLTLSVDPVTGELSALIGEGRDQRVMADPLSLGAKWQELFGETPRPAVGCLEGTCAFKQSTLKGVPRPEPVAEPTPEIPPTATVDPKLGKPVAVSQPPAVVGKKTPVTASRPPQATPIRKPPVKKK